MFSVQIILCIIGVRVFARTTVITLLLLMAGACSGLGGTKGTPFAGLVELKPFTGQLYFYRPSRFTMSFAIPTMTIDGETVEGVRNGSYIVYELLPGPRQISVLNNANWVAGNIDFLVNVEEGERYFYRLTPRSDGANVVGPYVMVRLASNLHQVSEQIALEEMADLKFTRRWP